VIFLALLFILRKADGHAQSLIGSMSYVGDAMGHIIRSGRRELGSASRRGRRIPMRLPAGGASRAARA